MPIKIKTEYGDIIPSNILLSSAESQFTHSGREGLLKNVLDKISKFYDFIIIDTPPALNLLTVNAFVASDYLIIPMMPEILSLVGVSQISETAQTVRKLYNTNLHVMGILLTKYDRRTNLAKEVAELAKEIAKGLTTEVFTSVIRSGVSVAESPAHGESVLVYAPHSKPAHDYSDFVTEVLSKVKNK